MLVRTGVVVVMAVVLGHVMRCPFNKVEESFNTQAVHDAWLVDDLDRWDHLEFPGTVPRTFLGALSVAGVAGMVEQLLNGVVSFEGWYPEDGCAFDGHLERQVLARCILGLAWVFGFWKFAMGTEKAFGRGTAGWLCAMTAVQFHGAFYASRFLPNSLAMPFVLAAFGDALVGRRYRALFLLVAATTALRCDLLAIVIPLGALWTFNFYDNRKLQLFRAVLVSVLAVIVALAASVSVDTYLWRSPTWLWPEGAVFLYNNPVENRSSFWGVQPRHWYATSALPRALGPFLVLVPVGAFVDRRVALDIVFPALTSIALLSYLPHKELRFIFPALPLLNLAAAVACDRLFTNKKRRLLLRLALVAIPVGALVVTAAGTVLVFGPAAVENYPGGVALRRIQALYCDDPTPRTLHIDVAAATTGASRFGQEFQHWVYDKREDPVDYSKYDLRIAPAVPRDDVDSESRRRYFDHLADVSSYAGLGITSRWPFLLHRRAPALALLRRR